MTLPISPVPGITYSPTKRRFVSSSDDEILDEIDTSRSYRVGWPKLAPLPIRTVTSGAKQAIGESAESLNRFYELVRSMLEGYALEVTRTSFAYRPPMMQQANDNNDYLSLVVQISGAPSLAQLKNAVLDIRKLFQAEEQTYGKLMIEIINDHAFRNGLIHAFPLDPKADEAILKEQTNIFNLMLSEIKAKKEHWLLLRLSRRSVDGDPSHGFPTLIVETPSADSPDWVTICGNVKRQCFSHKIKLNVEVIYNNSLYSESGDDRLREMVPDDLAREMYMGSSMGRHGIHHSGTFGGTVKLEDGKLYALSCHHVVGVDKEEHGETGLQKELAELSLRQGRNASYLRQSDGNSHGVVSPSDQDKAEYETATEEALEGALRRIEEDKKWAASYNAVRDDARNKLAVIEAFETQREAGTLPNQSTRAGEASEVTPSDSEQFLLDWSLTSLAEHRLNLNAHEVQVIKYGRTSGFTCGEIFPQRVLINPDLPKWAGFAPYGFNTSNQGTAVEVQFKGGEKNSTCFIASGDLGSVVLHKKTGKWLGLIFGSTAEGEGLMTPIDLVIRDIEFVTGKKVVEPIFEEEP
ncbi:hypothetical protein DM02DRAFT_666961 [Periconia macrospinosa]|uniref:Uncharacterized protein n=1 Tax=Periconia macrospinosa TaxID=97972 RepID=A0A2V1EA41_9PLEO|nr:hypothetical protein DM02DRAFT_666961 [Periconia macrospinosa]